MANYEERIAKIILEFPESERKKLAFFIYEKTRQSLNYSIKTDYTLKLLSSLISINNKYNFLEDEILMKLKYDLFNIKVLHLRATILDLIVNDYYRDINLLIEPELWVHDIIKDIKISFNLEKNPILNIFGDFIDMLLKELKSIFISKNKKFGSAGNQLILDLLFLERFVNNYIEYDFEQVIEEISSNILERKIKNINTIKTVLDKYINMKSIRNKH